MIELFKQIKWNFLIFQKNNLITMIIGMTAFYMIVIFFLKDLGNIDKLITLLLFNEPTMVGFVFVGFAIILEKDQEVLAALFTTPINHHYYLLSRIITLSTISLICSFGMVLMAKGASFNLLHFSIGTFISCVQFSFVGIYIVSYTTEILHFILRSIPIIVLMSLPFLNYFGLTEISILYLFPIQGSLYLIDNSYSSSPNPYELIFGYVSILLWTPILYWFVYKVFRAKLVTT